LVGKEHAPIADGTQLTALSTVALWLFWQGGKPDESKTIIRQPGEDLPDRETLGHDDQTKWEKGLDGKPKDPWADTRYVYLTNPLTAEIYTFTTTSGGGHKAVHDLGEQIELMRSAYPGATPIVELRSAPWPTRYGMKSRPLFKVVDWETGAIEGEAVAKPASVRRLTQQEKNAADKKNIDDAMGGDSIP
jgi:hypothetical protein